MYARLISLNEVNSMITQTTLENWKSLFDRLAEGVIILDSNREIVFLNEWVVRHFHLQHKHTNGTNLEEVLPESLLYTVSDKLDQMIELQQKELEFEIRLKNDQPLWLLAKIFLSDESIQILLEDITSKNLLIKNDIQERLSILCETANHLIYKNNLKEIFDSLFQELADYLDLDIYFNYMYQESSNKLKLLNFHGIPERKAKEIEWLDLGEAVCGTVAKTSEPMFAEHIQESMDPKVALVKSLGIQSYVCHPLMSYGKLIGTLSFGSSKRAQFSSEELKLVETICAQLAATLERTNLISELKKKIVEAEQANRARSEFLSMISHELRTPLNSILGFAQILESDTRDPLTNKQLDRLSKILKSGRHLLTLINDLLDLIKADSGTSKQKEKQTAVSLDEVLNECVKMVQPLANNKNIHLAYHSNGCLDAKVLVDNTRLKQAILNLLTNAIKYTDNSGEVTIICEKEHDMIKVSIKDNGIGIASEDQEKIFEPFYRVFDQEKNIEGSGIGLTLVKQFIEGMDGTVGLSSEKGIGSCFWIKLPLSVEKQFTAR
jgi:signal transduction histidine kinase